MKTAQEMKNESQDAVFLGIKKDKRDQLFKGLMKIRKDADIVGIKVKQIDIPDYYMEEGGVRPPILAGILIIQR